VVGGAIAVIDGVRFVEARGQARHADRADDRERFGGE
jgi:hypothetical protein